MKVKFVRILSLLAILVLAYMVVTDAAFRWFGWKGYGFNICFFCSLPLLVKGLTYNKRRDA